MLAEDVFDDMQDSLVLEDAAVTGAGEKPEPGDQGSLVWERIIPGRQLSVIRTELQ